MFDAPERMMRNVQYSSSDGVVYYYPRHVPYTYGSLVLFDWDNIVFFLFLRRFCVVFLQPVTTDEAISRWSKPALQGEILSRQEIRTVVE